MWRRRLLTRFLCRFDLAIHCDIGIAISLMRQCRCYTASLYQVEKQKVEVIWKKRKEEREKYGHSTIFPCEKSSIVIPASFPHPSSRSSQKLEDSVWWGLFLSPPHAECEHTLVGAHTAALRALISPSPVLTACFNSLLDLYSEDDTQRAMSIGCGISLCSSLDLRAVKCASWSEET